MEFKDYLPLGTVLILIQYKEQKQEINHMIIGYDCINSETNQQFKYSLVVYPYGLATDNIWYANEEDVCTIVFTPKVNEQCYNMEVADEL